MSGQITSRRTLVLKTPILDEGMIDRYITRLIIFRQDGQPQYGQGINKGDGRGGLRKVTREEARETIRLGGGIEKIT